MPELFEYFNNDPAFIPLFWIGEWINCSNSNNLVFTGFCDKTFDMRVEYAVDNAFNIISTETKNVLAGVTDEFFISVKTRFIRYSVVNIGASPSNLVTSGFFFLTGSEPIEIIPSPVVTSAGGVTLIKDANGHILRGLVAGTSITLVSNTNDITINGTASASTVWQESGGVITPQTANTNGMLSGDTTLTAVSGVSNVVVGGKNTQIVGGIHSGSCSTEDCDLNYTRNSLITASTNCDLNHISTNLVMHRESFIGGSNGCVILGGGGGADRAEQNTILASLDSNIESGKRCGIYSATNASVTFTSVSSQNCCIFGGENNTITSSSGLISRNNEILGGVNHTITGYTVANTIIGGYQSSITSVHYSTTIGGYCVTTHSGCFNAGDNSSTNMASVANNQYSARFASGYRLFTNAAQTTGMSLLNSSWAAVSDVNKKENLIENNYIDVLEKMRSIRIFKYNYIGSDPAIINYGCISQEWHSPTNFKCGIMTKIVEDNFGNPKLDDESNIVTEEVCAKDCLTIEQGDQIGVLLCCVKGLLREIDQLKVRITLLEN